LNTRPEIATEKITINRLGVVITPFWGFNVTSLDAIGVVRTVMILTSWAQAKKLALLKLNR